ncbi:hypothetical protein EBT25_09595 [bacterium]|nr:hypothetical protein [bacterium]
MKKDLEPAFARPHSEDKDFIHFAQSGMTLRDYFAAKAMLITMPAVINELKKTRGSIKEAIRLQDMSAETCYALADAMLKARET